MGRRRADKERLPLHHYILPIWMMDDASICGGYANAAIWQRMIAALAWWGWWGLVFALAGFLVVGIFTFLTWLTGDQNVLLSGLHFATVAISILYIATSYEIEEEEDD